MPLVIESEPPAPPACVSVTPRSPQLALVPLSPEGQQAGTAEAGVELQLGESWCVDFALDAAGNRVQRFEPLEQASSPPLRAQLALLADGTTVLSLQNDTPRELWVEYAVPVDAGRYLSESKHALVPSGQRVYATFPRRIERVLITTAMFLPERRRTEALPRRAPGGRERVEREGVLIGMGLVGGYGVHGLSSGSLNRELAQNGYSLLGGAQAVGTGTLWFELGRLRLDLHFFYGAESVRHLHTADTASFSFGGGGLDVGWELLRLRGFTFYPFIGIGGANRAVEQKYQDQAPLIASITPAAPASQSIDAGGWLLASGVAFDQVLGSFWEDRTGFFGFSLGGKLGYHAQLSHSDWELSDSKADAITFRGGPRADVGGVYGLFTLGVVGRAAGF